MKWKSTSIRPRKNLPIRLNRIGDDGMMMHLLALSSVKSQLWPLCTILLFLIRYAKSMSDEMMQVMRIGV